MTLKQKFLYGALALATTVGTYLYINKPTGFKGFYDNSVSSYFGNTAAANSLLAWHQRNGDNAIYAYGFDSKITSKSNWPWMAWYIKEARKKGITTFGIPYSNSNVTTHITNYNAAQPNDSSRINALASEIEPYLTGDYAGFYYHIRTVSNWAKKQKYKVERVVYMGWPTAQCWDSIVTHTDRLFLHAYLQPERMTGAGIRGYTKSRTGTIANIVNKKYSYDPNFKYNIVILFSTETSFAYNYFKLNSWDKPFPEFVSYFNSNATSVEKNRLTFGGRQIFKMSSGRLARP